jgi:hypothetical protein
MAAMVSNREFVTCGAKFSAGKVRGVLISILHVKTTAELEKVRGRLRS